MFEPRLKRHMNSFEHRNAHFDRLFNVKGLFWLGQNTNHLPMHPAVRKALIDSIELEEFHAYAPLDRFHRTVARDCRRSRPAAEDDAALVTDGAVAALATVCRAFCEPQTNFVTTDPGWKWPMQFARQQGTEVREIPIYDAAAGFRLLPKQLGEAVDTNTRIIYLVDPNNPLGICYTRAEIEAFCEVARNVGAYSCMTAPIAILPTITLGCQLLSQREITIYSFSKWSTLAGLASAPWWLTPRSSTVLRLLDCYSWQQCHRPARSAAGLAVKKNG